MSGPHRRIATRTLAVAALAAASTALAWTPASGAPSAVLAPASELHLVTLHGPGVASYDEARDVEERRTGLMQQQDETLASVDAPAPIYRWTSALNGYAVDLTEEQARDLAAHRAVASVEADTVLELAALEASDPAARSTAARPDRGGAGTVIGIVDSGIWPDNPLFAAVPGLGRAPKEFRGECVPGEDWARTTCNDKVVGARWFVAGFGVGNLRANTSLSARDDDGHGSQVASVAAGNAGVSVHLGDEPFGTYGGAAPQARIAAYKACWSAPDPADDGCASADVVTAIDRATADGVDVLNLSVAGTSAHDTVSRALLGATEADVVVTAAAGNDPDSFAGHGAPWVLTVGAGGGQERRGSVRLDDGTVLGGAMASNRRRGPARVVRAEDVAAPGADPVAAAQCRPGTLDASRVQDRIVVCERGAVGRVDKSATVALADGIGMILVNPTRGAVSADLHAVPTVHLAAEEGRRLLEALAERSVEATLIPEGLVTKDAVPAWSGAGDPRGGVVKPDLVAPGVGVLGATPPTGARGLRWDFFSGTSAAAAFVAGRAAALRAAEPDWSASAIRSALTTTARPIDAGTSSLRQGAGVAGADAGQRPGLVLEVEPGDYRHYAQGRLSPPDLNTPSVKVERGRSTVTRRVTNVGPRPMYYSSSTSGFAGHRVEVTPAALRIAPGETKSFTVRIEGAPGPRRLDSGWVTWLGAQGVEVRIPVVVSR